MNETPINLGTTAALAGLFSWSTTHTFVLLILMSRISNVASMTIWLIGVLTIVGLVHSFSWIPISTFWPSPCTVANVSSVRVN